MSESYTTVSETHLRLSSTVYVGIACVSHQQCKIEFYNARSVVSIFVGFD